MKNPVFDSFDPTLVALDLVPVTPSDTVDLPKPARSLRIAVGGSIRVTTYWGDVRDTTVIDGEVLNLYVSRVHETGTDADGIEAMI